MNLLHLNFDCLEQIVQQLAGTDWRAVVKLKCVAHDLHMVVTRTAHHHEKITVEVLKCSLISFRLTSPCLTRKYALKRFLVEEKMPAAITYKCGVCGDTISGILTCNCTRSELATLNILG